MLVVQIGEVPIEIVEDYASFKNSVTFIWKLRRSDIENPSAYRYV